ncbi:MAG: FlgD immunoglobulin-like domain containing protein, partial [Reichenbachiella sp.]|uniref:FlgD immunoglobulin-like domain containing protein n=2 Tax=Reichenbachiella sp. TaxID=2184521 RepID=UPI0032972072
AFLSDNTIFRPFVGGVVVSSISFLIFDSFNREVYTATLTGEDLNLDDLGWDGNLKSGQQAPEGVYYYNVSITYDISEDVSDKYFVNGEREQTQHFSKLGSVLLVK